MASEIWREFDPNLDIPIGLINAKEGVSPSAVDDAATPDADIDSQFETIIDEESELYDDDSVDELAVPGTFEIISQTVRTAPDGSQVVDVVIDVEEVPNAVKYEVRVTKA